MQEKIKKNLIGFILGLITTLSISVIAATYFPSGDVIYDNTVSGLESTNVQGAIDELYGVCTAKPPGEQIIEDNGLEKDPYECRYFFTGANPNNYITFNGETAGWRIISAECDGTIKIMRINDINISGNLLWGSYLNNNWASPTQLNTYLNGTYLNSLTPAAQSQIVDKDFSIGKIIENNNDLAGQVSAENSTKWNGKIALPTVSEYLRTNSNASCNTYTYQLYNEFNGANTCKNTTWMYTSNINYMWTLSGDSESADGVFHVHSSGNIYPYSSSTRNGNVKPTLYLSSNLKLSGSGTSSDPYTIN